MTRGRPTVATARNRLQLGTASDALTSAFSLTFAKAERMGIAVGWVDGPFALVRKKTLTSSRGLT